MASVLPQQTGLGCIALTIDGVDRPFYFRHDGSDKAVMEQIFANRDYEMGYFPQAAFVGAYYNTLRARASAPLIIDAGANIGASTVWLSTHFPGSHVVAIEPEKDNCELIRRNCQGLDYTLIEGGLGCEDGTSYLDDPGRGSWAFRLAAEGGKYAVPMFAASGIVEAHKAKGRAPFIFKIDIEGGESDLFRDDVSWMREFPVIIIELHDWLYPGTSNSRTFREAVARLDIDLTHRGENIFIFNEAACRSAG